MFIFVYGTLKKGFSNHSQLKRILASSKYLNVRSKDKYLLYEKKEPFPYLSFSKGRGRIVKGQLFNIFDSKEKELDYFEDVPNLYKKGKIDVIDSSNVLHKNVNVYFDAVEFDINQHIELLEEWIE